MDLEGITPSEISQSQKDRFHLYEVPRIVKSREKECRIVIARSWREGKMESYYLTSILILQDEKSCRDKQL